MFLLVTDLLATECLYDFSTSIEKSGIENSGYGAFLTYQGARVLKPRAAARSSRLIREHVIYSVGTHAPLVAETLGGRRMNVTLTGDNLHHNNNSIYWSKKCSERFFEFQNTREKPADLFDEDMASCNVHNEVKSLRKNVPDGHGIGFLGINTVSDYM